MSGKLLKSQIFSDYSTPVYLQSEKEKMKYKILLLLILFLLISSPNADSELEDPVTEESESIMNVEQEFEEDDEFYMDEGDEIDKEEMDRENLYDGYHLDEIDEELTNSDAEEIDLFENEFDQQDFDFKSDDNFDEEDEDNWFHKEDGFDENDIDEDDDEYEE